MNQAFDPLNLLILAVAVIIFFRLRSVLGSRTGHERRYDPLTPTGTARKNDAESQGNVIKMPGREPDQRLPGEPEPEPQKPVWEGVAEPGSELAEGLSKIAAADPTFTVAAFLEGARIAYEMIVTSFAQGDKKTLKDLLSRDVLDGFSAAIDSRARAGETMETRFVGIEKSDLFGASLDGHRATVTVRFVSEMITATRNAAGDVVEGDPRHIREITDVWTFERDVSTGNPNWKLAATEAVN